MTARSLTTRLVKILEATRRGRYVHTALILRQEDDMEKLQKNPYYDKYAEKIAKAQNTSPREFLDRLSKLEASVP